MVFEQLRLRRPSDAGRRHWMISTPSPLSLGRGDHPKFHAGSRGKGWVVDTIGPVHEDVSDIAWSQQSQCLAFANGNRYRREKAFERSCGPPEALHRLGTELPRVESARTRTAGDDDPGSVSDPDLRGRRVSVAARSRHTGRARLVLRACRSRSRGCDVPCQGWGAVVLRSVDRRA